MPLEKFKRWDLKRRIIRNKKTSTFVVQEARRILEARNKEFLSELRKTVREETIPRGPRKTWTLVSVGTKKNYDPIKYKYLDEYHAEIGHEKDIANFTYKKLGKTMLLTDLAVGPYYGESSLRRLGIARLMIDLAIEIAKREGLLAIRIGSDPSRAWLKEMYKKFGFVSLSEVRAHAEMIYFVDKSIESKFNPQRPWDILDYLRS